MSLEGYYAKWPKRTDIEDVREVEFTAPPAVDLDLLKYFKATTGKVYSYYGVNISILSAI